jgi:tRNA(Ile)-lysidine synthase
VSGFLQRAENGIQERQLFLRGQKILVAVSGGADSMVLLHTLHALAEKNRWRISVAHFNHQLRGRASDADEKLVRQTAEKLKLPFFDDRADVKQFAARSKISIEMAARKLRHEFFKRIARAQKISAIALAHHADDQVELFFLRLLRGAGGEGLAGMKWRSPSPADKKIALVRPLLGFSKNEILEYAREHKIRFRADATNSANDFLRNRIRNELLPLLQKKYQSGLTKTVLRLMEITGAESEFVGAVARNDCRLPIADCRFDEIPVAVQRKILQRQLIELGVGADFELIEQLRAGPEKFVSVGAQFAVARDMAGKVELRKQPENKFNANELKIKLSAGAGHTEFNGRKFQWSLQRYDGSRGRSLHLRKARLILTEFFDADKIGSGIILRHWRACDRFQPIGLPKPAKLQDLFVNAKIPAAQRRKLVLATTAAGEIFWVEGLRISENFKLTPATRRQLKWGFTQRTQRPQSRLDRKRLPL